VPRLLCVLLAACSLLTMMGALFLSLPFDKTYAAPPHRRQPHRGKNSWWIRGSMRFAVTRACSFSC
jgi:hypothetical protein